MENYRSGDTSCGGVFEDISDFSPNPGSDGSKK